MKIPFFHLLSLLAAPPLLLLNLGEATAASSLAYAQKVQYEFPENDGVDYGACLEEIDAADVNLDGALGVDEYRAFAQAYERRVLQCEGESDATIFELSLDEAESIEERDRAFHALACMCRCRGEGRDCCEGERARVAAGAGNAGDVDDARTYRDYYHLTTICQVTDGSILAPRCSEIASAKAAAPVEEEQSAGAAASGLSKANAKGCTPLAVIVVAGVFLLGLGSFVVARCCCCPGSRRTKKHQNQAQRSAAGEKEDNGTVAEEHDDDDATEVSEEA